jgi:hypothetical protein
MTYWVPLNDSVFGPECPNLLRTSFIPMAIADPIAFEVLLHGATHSLADGSQDPNMDKRVLFYRGNILRLVRDALNDPIQAVSDATIVGLIELWKDEVGILFLIITF